MATIMYGLYRLIRIFMTTLFLFTSLLKGRAYLKILFRRLTYSDFGIFLVKVKGLEDYLVRNDRHLFTCHFVCLVLI